jgi:hypothetical protein
VINCDDGTELFSFWRICQVLGLSQKMQDH